MEMTSAGAAFVPQAGFPVDGGAQLLAARQKAAANAKKLEASLPGNGGETEMRHLSAAAADLQRISLAFNKKLQFVVDHLSKEITVKVIDKETDKVIKVLPPEELQRMHSRLKEAIGFLFDERV